MWSERVNTRASAVMYGKHQAFGDFLTLGLPPAAFAVLDQWLDNTLPVLRQRLGGRWHEVWAAAPPSRFWIGPDVLGVPLIGVFMTSSDKVGRQFPLIFGLGGVLTPPPVDPAFDPTPYAALWSHIDGFEMPKNTRQDGTVLVSGFDAPDIVGDIWTGGDTGTLWAQRSDGNLQRLFADARTPDAAQAQFNRSHWWQDTGWLGCNGLPDATALEWLLSGQNKEDTES